MRRVEVAVLVTAVLGLVAVGVLTWTARLGFAVGLVAFLVLAGLVVAFVQWRKGFGWFAVVVAGASLLLAGVVSAYLWTINDALDEISRVPTGTLAEQDRPEKVPNESLNILLMGADDPRQLVDKPTVEELLADGDWNPGAYRSDTVMLVHVPADRSAAYLVSIPRDSYVTIYDAEGETHGKQKINAAFAEYGPIGTWRTVEELSDLHIDHMAIIDFDGFRDVTTAIGGVDVYVPENVYDSKQDQEWEQGDVHLEGALALKYVRMRYGLEEGDFSRVDRQQNFLRAVLHKVLSSDTIGNPGRFPATVRAIASHLTVDEGWSNGAIRGLAFDLRKIDADKVRFMTLPDAGTDTVPVAGSIVRIDEERAEAMFQAIRSDKVGVYLRRNPDDELPDESDVE